MSLIKCSECGNSVSDKATACPHCGCPMQKSEIYVGYLPDIEAKPPVVKKTKRSKLSFAIIMACLGIILASLIIVVSSGLSYSTSNPQNWSSQTAESRVIAQIAPTLEKVGIDADNVSYVERVGDWAYGQRYSIHYDGKTYLIYLNQDGSVNSINRGNVKLYENGIVKHKVY